ncbi:MAG: ABC transporter ATP-binding protein, partial [Gammaproteobacteria bacterium]
MTNIRVDNLTIDFGGLRALDAVTLGVEEGERRVILGPNGAGKTTLFNVMTGLLRPASGAIRLFDEDVTSFSTHRRARLGLGRTFQITTLFPMLTVLDSVLLALRGKERLSSFFSETVNAHSRYIDRAEQLLEEWRLRDRRDTPARELSYGEQRQLELVMALAMQPRVLLLDEPTAGLSPAETTTVAAMIKRFPGNLTVLLIEHDMDVALDLADRITVMHQGAVLV